MNIILFDTPELRKNLLPLTYTRPVAEFRCGIFTLSEKWSKRGQSISFLTDDYLSVKYPANYYDDNIYLNGATFYSSEILEALKTLNNNEGIEQDGVLIAYRTSEKLKFNFDSSNFQLHTINHNFQLLENTWDVFILNGQEIRNDYRWIAANGTSKEINDKHTAVYGQENIFIEEGAKIKASILNAENGPIYLGKGATIEEGSIIKGPFALCDNATVNMGAKIKGDSTVGPHCKVGGEVSNSVLFGFSSKGHDGFIGNSVIGEWCNLGADTNTSNLKNNYADVKLWNYQKGGFKNTESQFCGLIMGDHSKCGINTMFNTGTVVGVSANIFGSGFPRNFIPSFAWGGASGLVTYQPKKVYEVAQLVMIRRNKDFDEVEKSIMDKVFELSSEYRVWES